MKYNYLIKSLLVVVLTIFSPTDSKADNINDVPPTPMNDDWGDNGGDTGQGSGTRAVPVDDYAGILLVAGIAGASLYYTKKKNLIIKNK